VQGTLDPFFLLRTAPKTLAAPPFHAFLTVLSLKQLINAFLPSPIYLFPIRVCPCSLFGYNGHRYLSLEALVQAIFKHRRCFTLPGLFIFLRSFQPYLFLRSLAFFPGNSLSCPAFCVSLRFEIILKNPFPDFALFPNLHILVMPRLSKATPSGRQHSVPKKFFGLLVTWESFARVRRSNCPNTVNPAKLLSLSDPSSFTFQVRYLGPPPFPVAPLRMHRVPAAGPSCSPGRPNSINPPGL